MSQYNFQTRKKLKLLCMHGMGTNKQFMKMQTNAISKQLQDIAQFIYIDGPTVLPQQMVFDHSVFKYLKNAPRSWFNSKLYKTRTHEQIMEALQNIRVAIESVDQYYDGAFCFSQGAMAFQVIYMFHKLGLIKWKSFENIKFFMNFSSVAIRATWQLIKWQRFEIPSIHILSEQDVYFEEMMLTLTRFKNPEIVLHTFGHKFPSLGRRQKKKIVQFMSKYGYGVVKGIQLNSKL